jgi:hypothetical protein
MLQDIAKKCLDHGFLLRLIYQDNATNKIKYCCVIKGNWFNKLKVQKEDISSDIIYDICLEQPFNITNIDIKQIDYVNAPEGIDIQDLTSPSESFKKLGKEFLENSETYMEGLKTNIVKLKLNYNDFLKENFLLNNQEFNSDAEDLCILKLYPKVNKITKSKFKQFKQELIEEFFTLNKNTEDQTTIERTPALEMFNMCETLLDCSDPILLNALKRQWIKLIEVHKIEFLNKINNIDKSVFEPEELEEFESEAQILKQEIEKTTLSSLSNLNTVKSVISFWPEILQPNPYFVYARTN